MKSLWAWGGGSDLVRQHDFLCTTLFHPEGWCCLPNTTVVAFFLCFLSCRHVHHRSSFLLGTSCLMRTRCFLLHYCLDLQVSIETLISIIIHSSWLAQVCHASLPHCACAMYAHMSRLSSSLAHPVPWACYTHRRGSSSVLTVTVRTSASSHLFCKGACLVSVIPARQSPTKPSEGLPVGSQSWLVAMLRQPTIVSHKGVGP